MAEEAHDALQDHWRCYRCATALPVKGQLRGEQGTQSGYEKLLIEQHANQEPKLIEKIQREYGEAEIATNLNLSAASLGKRTSFILGALLDNDRYAVQFDALRKVDGPSALGVYRYEPVLFARRHGSAMSIASNLLLAQSFWRKFRRRFLVSEPFISGGTAQGRANRYRAYAASSPAQEAR